MFASRDIYFGKKRGVICAVDFTYTRSLLDIFEWAVPASFLSYAPTFFGSNNIFCRMFAEKYLCTHTLGRKRNALTWISWIFCKPNAVENFHIIEGQSFDRHLHLHILVVWKKMYEKAPVASRYTDLRTLVILMEFLSTFHRKYSIRTLLFPASTGGHLDIL